MCFIKYLYMNDYSILDPEIMLKQLNIALEDRKKEVDLEIG
jgi:hypothetical protein